MKYLCAQPGNKYYIWQVDAMLTSFEDVGVNLPDVHVVFGAIEIDSAPDIMDKYNRLMEKWAHKGVNIYTIKDDEDKVTSYISAIRPRLFSKFWEQNPWMEKEAIFYHDCDIALTKPLDFSEEELNDDVWYVSDTVSYIGYNYIKEFDRDIMDTFLDVFDLDEEFIKSQQEHSGGCHYLMKNVTKEYWDDINKKSSELYERVTKLQEGRDKLIQIWPSDMWACLWCAWERNHKVRLSEKLDFTWSIDPVSRWEENAIYHNAGVVSTDNRQFYKGAYIVDDVPNNLDIDQTKAFYKYYQLINKANGHQRGN